MNSVNYIPNNDSSSVASPAATLIVIKQGQFDSKRGQIYNDLGEGGDQIVANSVVVEYDACRAMLAKGIFGALELCNSETSAPYMRFDCLEAAANLTIRDDANRGPQVVPFRARPVVDDTAPAQEGNRESRRASSSPKRKRSQTLGATSRRSTSRAEIRFVTGDGGNARSANFKCQPWPRHGWSQFG